MIAAITVKRGSMLIKDVSNVETAVNVLQEIVALPLSV